MEGLGIPAPGLTFLLASVVLASRGEMLTTSRLADALPE
jgi:hypothetical protein